MAFRLFFDEDSLHRAVLAALRAHDFDCLTVTEAGRQRLTDESQLEFATAERRVVLTRNIGDFARLHSRYVAEGRQHAGIIIITDQSMAVGPLLAAMLAIRSGGESEILANRLLYLQNFVPRD